MERAYTVIELDALRNAVEQRWLFGSLTPAAQVWGRCYLPSDKYKAVEELVRTHMLAGHTASDLYAADSEAAKPALKSA